MHIKLRIMERRSGYNQDGDHLVRESTKEFCVPIQDISLKKFTEVRYPSYSENMERDRREEASYHAILPAFGSTTHKYEFIKVSKEEYERIELLLHKFNVIQAQQHNQGIQPSEEDGVTIDMWDDESVDNLMGLEVE